MIFATCGSSHYPFERMMAALAALNVEDLHIQHGPATPPACTRAYRFLPFEDLLEQMRTADVVVTHAGVGSILGAIRMGQTPVVFPRLKRYSEAVDDHQSELAEVLAERGTAFVARSSEELVDAIKSIPARAAAPQVQARALIDAVRATIIGAPLRAVPLEIDQLSARLTRIGVG